MDPIPSSPSLSPMMGPGIRLEDTFTVDYDSPEEIDASMYQVSWTNVMAEGRYRSPSVYKKVEVLMLCWQENNCAMKTKGEVERLRSVFQDGFGYRVSISYLNAKGEQSLQLQVNAEVAVFARKHDGRDTLLIVYYAGHGKPGEFFGDLELFGQISPNDPRDEKRRLRNRVVWNKTEDILRPVVADVLEIFDCCHAGTLGLTRGENRLFEYLAAANAQGTTKAPGRESFTSALVFALEALKDEKPNGRFTTDELLRKITTDAPDFPKDQTPVLSDRDHKKATGGRIMLHPLRPDQRRVEKPSEGTPADQKNRHIMTLHFDFGQLPSEADLTTLGRDFNEIFERNTLGVDRVRWGGIRRTAFGFAARKWRRSLRNRRASSKGGTVGHLKHKGPRPLPAMPSIDTGFLSPQAAAFTSQDSVETESPQSLIPSSAPTSDMEKESEGSATVTGSIQDAFEKLRKARKDNKKSMP